MSKEQYQYFSRVVDEYGILPEFSDFAHEIDEQNHLKARLVLVGKTLFERGYAVGSAGNISVRMSEERFLVTNRGACLGRLDANELSMINHQGEVIFGDEPTKEHKLHLTIYQAKPEVNAIIHLHSTYLTALSLLQDLNNENALKAFTPFMAACIGKLPVVPYYAPGSQALIDATVAKIQDCPAVLLANHGVIVTGKNLYEAFDIIQELEEVAKMKFTLADTTIHYLSEEQCTQLTSKEV